MSALFSLVTNVALRRVPAATGLTIIDNDCVLQGVTFTGAATAVLGDAGVHARSAVKVAVLPLHAPVEVGLIVQVTA